MKKAIVGAVVLVSSTLILAIVGLLVAVYQGKRKPQGDPVYVAMGSSFAAGIGLDPRVPGSPIACMRTLGSYPQHVSKLLGVPLLDVTCSAATNEHVLRGGQYFQRAQLDALRDDTKLVTITSGGNDIRYVGDLSFIAARNTSSVYGWLMKRLWRGPLRPDQRDYEKVRGDLILVAQEVRIRSPRALLIMTTYPAILPPSGTCALLNLSELEAESMRSVGLQLAEAIRSAAKESGTILVDMQSLGASHHACSPSPWVNGWQNAQGTQFHPTRLGARSMAEAIAQAVRANS